MSFLSWLFDIIPSLGYFNLTLMPQKEKEKKEENVQMEGVICKGQGSELYWKRASAWLRLM
jgi:hypothetical protein